MFITRKALCCAFLLAACFSNALAQPPKQVQVKELLDGVIAKNSLVTPGAPPFYLKATISNTKNPDDELAGTLEEYWLAPDKYRREIKTKAFSQTRIVNGANVFEQNSSDYFPWALEELVTALVDPIPAPFADTMRNMDFPVQKPDGSHNACRADKYVTMKERFVFTLNCETGNLWWINIPGWDAGVFDDFRRFHDKHIAYKTKDNPLVYQINELRDLKPADDALFAIASPTSPAKTIRTVYVKPDEYRKTASKTPDFKWPQLTNYPDTGEVSIEITVDKTGHVRNSFSYVASNNEVKDAAVEQIKNWEFKPYVVSGVPVQVETELVVPFKAPLKPDPNRKPPANSFFDRARAVQGIRVKDSSPFHLKATFNATGDAETIGTGTYEETWVSPTQWRREATLGGKTVIESRNDDDRYRQFKGDYAPRRADEVIDIMGASLPGDNDDFYAVDWHVKDGTIGSMLFTRVYRGFINDQDVADINTVIYFFSQTNGLLRARFVYAELTAFNDFSDFLTKQVPRHITVGQNRKTILDISVDTLETVKAPDESSFILKDAKKWSMDDDESGSQMAPPKPIKQVKPVYPEQAMGVHQKLSCVVSVDQNGHPRTVEFQGNYNDYLKASLVNALMQWEFQPGIIKGRPVGFPFKMQYQF